MDQKRILPDRKPYLPYRFSADILADMAFSKFHTAPLGRSDQIDLLELFRLHGQFQTVGKGFICHRKSP